MKKKFLLQQQITRYTAQKLKKCLRVTVLKWLKTLTEGL